MIMIVICVCIHIYIYIDELLFSVLRDKDYYVEIFVCFFIFIFCESLMSC